MKHYGILFGILHTNLKFSLFCSLSFICFISCNKVYEDSDVKKENLFCILNKFDKNEFNKIDVLKDTTLRINNLSLQKINNILENYNSYYPKKEAAFKELYYNISKKPEIKYYTTKGNLLISFSSPIYNAKGNRILLYNEISNNKTYSEAFVLLIEKSKDSLIVVNKEQLYSND